MLEMAANGTALDAGQAFLVRQMCTSGARLQLAIAPAGAGKTTAMRALTLAWTEDGGHLLGLAPSAAAAAVLAEQTGIRTETLAKLTWSLEHGDLPDWAAAVGPSTLVIIDEVGMADTLSLDTAVQFAIGRGASVRLVGDDQQLAAIGAGGILRDIHHSHGALHLTELDRFTDPAEASASLALREGKPEALDFYLDHGRVRITGLSVEFGDKLSSGGEHDRVESCSPVGNPSSECSLRGSPGWPRGALGGWEPGRRPRHQASVGDVIITRTNHRRLRLTATDWVKNGDGWTITHVGKHGDVTVRHNRSHRTVRLPADHVRTSAGLGYAITIHAAQGVSADAMHGLATGRVSRQQLYTMLSRGRQPTTSTCRSSATATRTQSSDPRPSRPAPRPSCSNRSWTATTPPLQPRRSSADSATRRPGYMMRSSATQMACGPPLSTSSDPQLWTPSTAKPSKSYRTSPRNRRGRPCEPTSYEPPPPPDHNNCRPPRPNGNNNSTEASPTPATTRPTRISGGRSWFHF